MLEFLIIFYIFSVLLTFTSYFYLSYVFAKQMNSKITYLDFDFKPGEFKSVMNITPFIPIYNLIIIYYNYKIIKSIFDKNNGKISLNIFENLYLDKFAHDIITSEIEKYKDKFKISKAYNYFTTKVNISDEKKIISYEDFLTINNILNEGEENTKNIILHFYSITDKILREYKRILN